MTHHRAETRRITGESLDLGMRLPLCPFEVVQKKVPRTLLSSVCFRATLRKLRNVWESCSSLAYEQPSPLMMEQRSESVDRCQFVRARVIDKPNGISLRPGRDMTPAEANEILTLETPQAEEIARAIWQRQHAALSAESLSYHAQWRDQSIPLKFWNEFLLDAHAILLLLHEKHKDFQTAREIGNIESPNEPSPAVDPLARHCARDALRSETNLSTVIQKGD